MNFTHFFRTSFLRDGKIFFTRPVISSFGTKSVPLRSCQAVIKNDAKVTIFPQVRRFSTNHQNVPNIDPKQQQRRRALTILTYASGFIGACLLTAVGTQEYQRLKLRARGIEPLKNRLYGRRSRLFYYRGYVLPNFVVDNIDNIHTFKVREDDIWIVSYPKAGTTWLQEVIYLIDNNADFESVKSRIEDRIPYFEFIYPGIKNINNLPSPRYIKTHLPFSLLPNDFKEKKPKTIYIARNAKDTVVSLYHFAQKFYKPVVTYHVSFDEFCQLFVSDQVMYGPWWKHVREAWERRNDDNVLFITYEDMKMDMPGLIKKIATFLGKTLSPQDVEAIAAHCSFDEMKKNNYVNYTWFYERGVADKDQPFMRKGKVGNWKDHISKEFVSQLDEIMAAKVEPTGLTLTDSFEDSDI